MEYKNQRTSNNKATDGVLMGLCDIINFNDATVSTITWMGISDVLNAVSRWDIKGGKYIISK